MAERTYCSEVAKAGNVSPVGTAVQVDLWLLIEYSRPWKPKAVEDNELSAEVVSRLMALPEAAHALGRRLRVQFIKQSTSDHRDKPYVIVVDGRVAGPRAVRGELKSFTDLLLLDAEGLCALSLPDNFAPAPLLEPQYLVCTNGQRDLCCARFGLPLYEALRMEFGDAIWQTTHIGGHRYAPNLLCLPSGLVYGFVAPETGVDFVRDIEAGRVHADQLRGRSCYSKEIQAAETFLRREHATVDIQSMQITAQTEVDCHVAFVGDVNGQIANGQIVVQRESLPPAIASCGGEAKPDMQFTLQSIEYS